MNRKKDYKLFGIKNDDPNIKVIKAVAGLIEQWTEKSQNKIIIGLDGTVGIGKTSISNAVAKIRKDVCIIHMDNFMYSDRKIIRQRKKSGGDLSFYIHKNWYDIKKVERLFRSFRGNRKIFLNSVEKNGKTHKLKYNLNKKVLLVEGIFLKTLEKYLERSIFLVLDKKQVISRRKKRWERLKKKEPKKAFILFENVWKYYLKKYDPQKKSAICIKMKVVDKFS